MYLLYYGVIDFYIGFLAGVKALPLPGLAVSARSPAHAGRYLIGLIETFWSGYYSLSTGRRGVLHPGHCADFLPSGLLGRPEARRSEMATTTVAAPLTLARLGSSGS
jgi:branched-chain amino acid transport system permease protein